MKRIVLSLIFMIVSVSASMIEYKSGYDFKTTVKNLKKNIEQNGFTIHIAIDHKVNAQKAGTNSNKSTTIIFDNPKETARMMIHDSRVAFSLPQKVFIYENLDDEVIVMYKSFKDLKTEFKVQHCQIIDSISNKIDRVINNSIN